MVLFGHSLLQQNRKSTSCATTSGQKGRLRYLNTGQENRQIKQINLVINLRAVPWRVINAKGVVALQIYS